MMLAGAAREEKGSVAGQGQVRLLGDCRGGIREFVNDADRPAFLERELMGFDVEITVDRSTCMVVNSGLQVPHPHPIPSAPFPGMLVHPCHLQAP